MRTAFIKTLETLAAENPKVTLITGDLGFGVVVDFANKFPNQFVNAGVAEQNMTGMAAGMALLGRKVFTYSIANFPTLRCIEQIRNDVCYHMADVKVVSVGGGFAYGALGMTHHATEDIGMLRLLPGMTVVAPGDPAEANAATRALTAMNGPAYLRLGRAGEPVVHKDPIDFEIGRAITTRDYGTDATLITTGGMLHTAVNVADQLMEEGIKLRVVSMHTIRPLDVAAVLAAATETAGVLTLEPHSVLGGLGSACAEVLCEAGIPGLRFKRLGVPSEFIKTVGSQEYLETLLGLDIPGVANTVREFVRSSTVRELQTAGEVLLPR